MSESDKRIQLSKVVVPKTARGTGVGSDFMKDLTKYADNKALRVDLTPSTSFGGSSITRLTSFYKKFGFVSNFGKNKDYEISDTMYRLPEAKRNNPYREPNGQFGTGPGAKDGLVNVNAQARVLSPGVTEYTYGDLKYTQTRERPLGDQEYVDNAVQEFGYWEGNYGSRVASANLMGIETPDTTGGENLESGIKSALDTGKIPSGITDYEKTRIQNAVALNVENASNLMVANVNSKLTEMPLYRGMTVAADDPIVNMAAGDTFELPLSSFGYDKGLSDNFAKPNQVYGTAPRASVMFVMEKGAKGASITDLDMSNTQINFNNEWITVPDEVISQGKYSVTSVVKGKLMGSPIADGADAIYINIKHDEVFNLKAGAYESVK
jgi:hypothetical protein